MDKASKVLRRSGVRIRSIGSGHSDLQMVIAQLKDVRTTGKAFSVAQSSAMQDLVKWSLKDENRAIQDALTQVGELFSVWTEVQRELTDHIKEFKHQFDMILEGAKQLDNAKTDLQLSEQKEGKIKKELKKAAKKATAEEMKEMTARLEEAEREKDLAQLEVVDRIREHEAVKMIRIKDGVSKVSEAYVDYAQKCDVIFSAQKEIALQIPDVHDKDIQDIKYTGAGSTMQAVAKAKDQIKKFRRRKSSSMSSMSEVRRGSVEDLQDLPPPYSENPPFNPFYNDLVHNVSNTSCHSELDMTRSPDDQPELDVGPSSRLSPLYPVLPHIPPYSPPHSHGDNAPPPFVTVTRRSQFGRRDSFLSDTEPDQSAVLLANMKLQSEQQQHKQK